MNRPDPLQVRPTRLIRLFPWTLLFRGPAIAFDTRKLLLASLGLVLSWAGTSGLDRIFTPKEKIAAFLQPSKMLDPQLLGDSPWIRLPMKVAEPFVVLIEPFVHVFRTGQGLLALLHAILAAIWLVMVWGTLGGAISRIAAVQQATGERIGLFPSIKFATGRLVALIGAPLSPMLGIGFFAALCLPIGLLYRIPGETGANIAGVLAFLPLFAGLVMAMLLAGLAVGWPLMTATVAVEAEDAFDALSRSYSYVTQRPGRIGLYTLLSWLIGSVGFLMVTLVAALAIHMAHWALALGGPDEKIAGFFAGDPTFGKTPALIHSFWISLIYLLIHGWLYSYFFTAATLIYVLLRREVDGTPFHDLGGMAPVDEPFADAEEVAESVTAVTKE